MFNKEDFKTDKSWGMIGAYHVQGSANDFFQSDISTPNFIEIVIKTAQKQRGLNRDWVMGDKTICTVKLTPLQWAEMLTSMNTGDGVPCTIKYTETDGRIQFMPEDDKLEVIVQEQNEQVNKASNKLEELSNKLKALNDDKRISNKAFEELDTIINDCKYSMDNGGGTFLKQQARKEIERMVAQAKATVSAYTEHKIRSVGLECIKNELPKLKGDIE